MSEAILQLVAEKVRAEYEQAIQDETQRRYAAVLAAIEGRATVEPAPAPPPTPEPEPPAPARKRRSDAGKPRLGRQLSILPAEEPELTVKDSVTVPSPVEPGRWTCKQCSRSFGADIPACPYCREWTAAERAEYVKTHTEPHAPTQEEREEMVAPEEDLVCATCEHYSQFHTGNDILNPGCCTIAHCSCRHFVPPDPLGLEGEGGSA